MAYDKLNRLIAERSFEYGPTTVKIEVVVHSQQAHYTPDYGAAGSSYVRKVKVTAVGGEYETKDNRVYNSSTCELVVSPRPPSSVGLSKLEELYGVVWPNTDLDAELEKKREAYDGELVPSGPAVDITTQIEDTVKPVLEKLDLHYELTGVEMAVDIDVTMEYLECETSLAEVDEEIASFTAQLESSGASSL